MKPNPAASVIEDKELPDISAIDLQKRLLVDNPVDREGYLRLRSYTPARIGIGHEGPRYKLASALRFRADHAAAQDSVFSDVPADFIEKMGMIPVETICTSKDDYLTNPPKGSQFSDAEIAKIKAAVPDHPKVEIVVGDGLSSAAITANIADILPAIRQGLQVYGLDFGNVIFVKHARVRAEDAIGEATGADVVCILIGERPGLVTAESMSAYVAYKPTVGMPEARRTVISNIHKGGTPAVEAGAHIAELIKNMLDYKASGIALKQAQGEPLDWDGTEA